MKLSRRWKLGLAIAVYAAAVIAMAIYSIPNAFRGADGFRDYQEDLTRQMAERAAEHRGGAAPAPSGAPAEPDPADAE